MNKSSSAQSAAPMIAAVLMIFTALLGAQAMFIVSAVALVACLFVFPQSLTPRPALAVTVGAAVAAVIAFALAFTLH